MTLMIEEPATGAKHVPTWDITDRLRKAREDAKLTQQQLSDITEISTATIKNYEAGKHSPSRPYLRLWAEATDVPLCWLAEGVACGCEVEPPIGLEPITCALQGGEFPTAAELVKLWAVSAR